MKKIYLLLTAVLFPLLFTAQTEPDQNLKSEFQTISTNFMSSLKSVLMKNLKEGGPTQAITVCSDTAQQLTNQIGEENNIILRRVTFKTRNPKDQPDEFESKILKQFHEAHDKGELSKDEVYIELVETDDGKLARFLQPIFVGGPCLTCHGSEDLISDDVKALLNKNYPNDEATGYKAGDLRGAISITKKL